MTNAAELLDKLTTAGVKFTFTPAGKISIDAPKAFLTDEHRQALRQYKAAILELLRRQTNGNSANQTNQPITFLQTPPEICSLCTCPLQNDDCAALLVRFCPLGCDFVWQAFNDWQTAYKLTQEMFDAATSDQYQTMTDLLYERAIIFEFENGFEYEQALRYAEADLIPIWLDAFRSPEMKGEKA